MERFNRRFAFEKQSAGSLAQNHTARWLMERFNRRFAFEKPPFVIGVAKQPVRFLRAYHETKIERFIVEQITRHLDCEQADGAISDKCVTRARNPEDRG